MLGRHRLVDVAPWKPLTEQSPVLASLAREPRGTRIADRRLRNLPMRVGLAPISAYRTLDLPAVGSLTALAMGSLSDPRIEAEVRAALRATGTGVRLIDPVENREDRGAAQGEELIEKRSTIRSWRPRCSMRRGSRSRGPWARQILDLAARDTGDARLVRAGGRRRPRRRSWTIGRAIHATFFESSAMPRRFQPSREHRKNGPFWIEATEPGWVIVTQLADPQWKARWINLDDTSDDGARDPAGVSQSE